MAWRPTRCLQEGELDNTCPNTITGWMKFAGVNKKVVVNLEGNFHRDIRGAKIHFAGDAYEGDVPEDAGRYMEDFALEQTGKAGDITAGMPPNDYGSSPYIEWFGNENGRVVLELEPVQLEVIGRPIPACESDPIDRKQQAENMAEFLSGMAEAVGIPVEHAIATGNTVAIERAKKVLENDKRRGMKLFPQEIRDIVPDRYAQDGKGPKAVAVVKFFTPSSSWTWYVLSGEPVLDQSQNEVDYRFFGLVFGHEREFGYFLLSELEEVRGPMGMPIERDLYFKPKPLAEIAPEMFEGGG